MLRLFKKSWWVWVLMGGILSSAAFSLLGPQPSSTTVPDGYQQPVIGYFVRGDVGGPKNLGEEYRWNLPVLYYAIDQNFFDYFGSNGMAAVEQAVAVFNGLTNVTSYSSDLFEFPLEASRINFRAEALQLKDLKSTALSFMIEELGLAMPDRYTWTLRSREVIPGLQCPFMIYSVIKRNFDPVTFAPSSYVNGTLYSYRIFEFCQGPDPLAEAVEFQVDPLADSFTAVAAFGVPFGIGGFYTGLTRDDVGGLRYLMRTNNFNVETPGAGSRLVAGGFTNTLAPQLITTSNLALFAEQALTNDAAQLQAIYPELRILSTTPFFTNVVTTNFVLYFTNLPGTPVGSPPSLATNIVRTTNAAARFSHSFENVVTNRFATSGPVTIRDTLVAPPPMSPVGTPAVTNVTVTTRIQNFVNGDFFLAPSNLCGFHIVSTQLVTTILVTNSVITGTNQPTGTNTVALSLSREIITYFTNYSLIVLPIDCGTNGPGLRQGINKITFIRSNFDSLLGQFFQPITNRYQLTVVTNFTPFVQTYERVVTKPDFLFSAEERMVPDGAWFSIGFRTIPVFNSTNGIPPGNPGAIAGPGIMEVPSGGSIVIEFNKVGPLLINIGPFFVDEATATTNYVWGSFDGTTNAPIIYPDITSLTNLEHLVLNPPP